MAKFETVKRFANKPGLIPVRATGNSAGYDLSAAEDTVVPSILRYISPACEGLSKEWFEIDSNPLSLNEVATKLKQAGGYRPTLVSTGIKCKLDEGTYLEISARSSLPLKHLLIVANGVGRAKC